MIKAKSKRLLAKKGKITKASVNKKSQPKQTKVNNNKTGPSNKTVNNMNINSAKAKIDLDFETAMLEMTFDNLAALMKTLGIPSPQALKIKQQAKLIATFNQKMIQTGHREQVINLGEKLIPWILKISTAGMFVEPIGKMLIQMADKKKENSVIIEESKSARI